MGGAPLAKKERSFFPENKIVKMMSLTGVLRLCIRIRWFVKFFHSCAKVCCSICVYATWISVFFASRVYKKMTIFYMRVCKFSIRATIDPGLCNP